ALGISTSGTSVNVLAGINTARAKGLATIGLCGIGGSLREIVDQCIAVPSTSTPRIQEAHILLAHVLCDLVERRLP
ncbi:MAG: phosphoheptose isomerase, partial [Solirubrobacteraceae bacterium]